MDSIKFIWIGIILLSVYLIFKRVTAQFYWVQTGILIISVIFLLYGLFKKNNLFRLDN